MAVNLLINTVYTRCGRLLELSSLLSGSLLQRLFISRLCLFCPIAVLYFCVCVLSVLCLHFVATFWCNKHMNNNNDGDDFFNFLQAAFLVTLTLAVRCNCYYIAATTNTTVTSNNNNNNNNSHNNKCLK